MNDSRFTALRIAWGIVLLIVIGTLVVLRFVL